MKAILACPDFFVEAPVGINCASGFITFSPDGEPHLMLHDPAHRCRHVLKGTYEEDSWTCPELVFLFAKANGSLLGQLLDGIFLGDEDAGEKRELLAEIAGAAALGYGTKLRQRGFTTPASSKAALREWLLGTDPVVAWVEARVEIVDSDGEAAQIKRYDAYADFASWAKREGFSEHTLPGVNTFVNRLRAHVPAIGLKHTSKGDFLIGFRIKHAEGDPLDAEFPFA